MLEKYKRDISYLNTNLPDNVCVMIYDISLFPIFLEKLNDLWTGVILPKDYKEDDILPWCMSYLQYEKDGEHCYLIWFFDDNQAAKPIDYNMIMKEIKQFLKDEKNNKVITGDVNGS